MDKDSAHGGIHLLPETILEHGVYWTAALNRNQNLLGKVMLVVNRPVDQVILLQDKEWEDLHRQARRVTAALTAVFHPEHFNYAFLQNVDRQVHLHVIPRYASSRAFGGALFDDPDYPGHYAVPAESRALTLEQVVALAETVRRAVHSAE